MDLTVILGVLGAIASISIGDLLDGGNPVHIIHLASLIIIFPTAMAAAAVATDAEYIQGAFKNIGPLVFKKSAVNLEERIKEIVELSTLARKDGLLSLEKRVEQIDNDFLKQCLSMAIDGNEIDTIAETMELVIWNVPYKVDKLLIS